MQTLTVYDRLGISCVQNLTMYYTLGKNSPIDSRDIDSRQDAMCVDTISL